MSQADRTTNNVAPLFHPVSHYEGPADVLRDARLSTAEKRVILSSWASDIYAVESRPAVRKIPGIGHELRLDDILTALRQLDDDDPPPGGMAMRLPRLGKVGHAACDGLNRLSIENATARRDHSTRTSRNAHSWRWTREANVRRYRRLLKTQLTDLERSFIKRRLAEELRG